jgi:hypothetical protein
VEYENFIMGAKAYINPIQKEFSLKIVEAGDGGKTRTFLKEAMVSSKHS